MTDLVSIVTTLYNYKCFIGDLIDSVQKQMYENWELIIVDDASTDRPEEVIKPRLKDRRIQYIRLEKNHGYSFAKNEGIIKSKGKFIAMIDADDRLTPNSIEGRYNLLVHSPNRLWCHANALLLGDNGKIYNHDADRRRVNGEKIAKMGLFVNGYHHRLIHPQTIMVHRGFHEKLGLYDETLRFSSDNEMFRRAIRFNVIPLLCPEFVCLYRCHTFPVRMSRSEEKKKNMFAVKEYIVKIVEQRFAEGINESNTRLLK